jgi:hypothetical protein
VPVGLVGEKNATAIISQIRLIDKIVIFKI